MENNMEVPQNIKNRTTIWSRHPTSGNIPEENKIMWKWYLHLHVHNSIIYNSQDMETTSVSINGWMDKEAVLYTHNGILFSERDEEILLFVTT